MDFSFINYVSNKDFDLHEILVSSLGKEYMPKTAFEDNTAA
jgi:hypothetical protein